MSHRMSAAILGALFVLSTAQGAEAARVSCKVLSGNKSPIPVADLQAQKTAGYDSPNIQALTAMDRLAVLVPQLRSKSNESFVKSINEILRNEELSFFHLQLKTAMEKVATSIESQQIQITPRSATINGETYAVTHAKAVRIAIAQVVKEILAPMMGPDAAAIRADIIVKDTRITAAKLRKALGEMTREEMNEALIGRNGIQDVSPDSIVGRFLQEQAAAGRPASTLIAQFPTAPTEGAPLGERRLFIAIDAQSAQKVREMVTNNPHLLVHNYDLGQGTLYLNHHGKNISYAKYNSNDVWNTTTFYENHLLPFITLSTTSATNAINYFTLGTLTNSARTKYPWSLVKVVENQPNELYVRPGGYTCCTHWFGEMPLGDRITETYAMPGQPDTSGRQADPLATDQRAIREAPVGSYTHFSQHNTNTPIGTESRLDRLTRIVWRSEKGPEQMWSMLNARAQFADAQLTNPGWILFNLLGAAPVDRVPVVFVYRGDATQPLTQEYLTGLKGRVSNY